VCLSGEEGTGVSPGAYRFVLSTCAAWPHKVQRSAAANATRRKSLEY
jgi:hypothetical protein